MKNSSKVTHALLTATVLALASATVCAGPLADFETAATQENAASPARARGNASEDSDYWLVAVLDVVGDVVSYGGRLSLARVGGDSGAGPVTPREVGSPDLPYLRVDFGYQDLDSGADALDGRLEAGFGPAALQYRLTHMRERSTQERLDLSYLHGLYRISGSDVFEMGVGVGQVVLEGEARNSGASLTVPLNIYPLPEIGIRLVPTWSEINGNTIRDYDGSVAYVQKYFSVRLGYRQIQSHQETLRGPYAGISFHY